MSENIEINGKRYVSRKESQGCEGCAFVSDEVSCDKACDKFQCGALAIIWAPAPIDPLSDEQDALTFGPLPDGAKDTNPKDAAASGRVPMYMVPGTLYLFAAIAFAEGDSKYIAYNFRIAGVRASVYISALLRHFTRYVNGEWADKKTKVPHLASVAACLAILIDGHVTKTIVDDRPPAVDLDEEFARAEEIIAHVYELNKDKRPVDVSYTIADTVVPA